MSDVEFHEERGMPEISRFFGIIITMYYKDHSPPHFHIKYKDTEAQFDIVEGVISKGILPSTQARLVLAWNEIHRAELLAMWERKEYSKVKPLE